MNPFKNTITHLYSSDVTKNKKDKHIFSAAKKQFQTRKTCKKQQNLRFYRNGKVRSNISYEYANDLARGNILCNNCDKPADTCGDIYINTKNKVAMHNNAFSQFIGGGVIVPEANYNGGQFEIKINQKQLVPIIKSDVSGSWDGTNEPSKANITVCGPSGNITCLYGYTNNLIKIPRNLDGSGVIIDPSNLLFPDNSCGFGKFRKFVSLKSEIILRGTIDLSQNLLSPSNPFPFEAADSCNDPSYNNFIGKFASIVVVPGLASGVFTNIESVFYGVIKKICCLNPLPDVSYNNGIPWMDIHIEVTKIGDEELLNKFIKFKPSYRGPNWRTDPIGKFAGPYSWDSFSPWALVTYKDTGVAGGTLSNVAGSLTPEGFFNDVNFIIGDCKSNLTQSNNKRNTYMYCLEDGTKKINFTKENPVNLG